MIVDCRVPELRALVEALAGGAEGLVRGEGSGPFLVIERSARGELELRRAGATVASSAIPDRILAALEIELDDEVPRLLRGLCAFHAGVAVSGRRGVLVAGESCAGKSTLTAALVQGGLDYVTDDTAVVEEDGSVAPCPRRMGLRGGTLALLGDLGERLAHVRYHLEDGSPVDYLVASPAARAKASCRVEVVAFLERRGPCATLRPIGVPEAVARLVAHALTGADPRRDLERARRLVESAPVRVVVEGGDPHAIARELIARLNETAHRP